MISLYFEKFNGDKPISNGGVEPYVFSQSNFLYHLNVYNIVYNFKGEKDGAWLVLEPMDLNQFFLHQFQFEAKTWDRIRNQSLKVVIWMPHEGTNIFNETFIEPLVNYFKIKGVSDFSNFYLVYGNIDAASYKKTPLSIIPLLYWDCIYLLLMKSRWEDPKVKEVEEVCWHENYRDKKFLCYNANLKKHRLLLISEILRKSYEDSFYLSALRRSYSNEGLLEDESVGQLLPYRRLIDRLKFFSEDNKIRSHYKKFVLGYEPIYLDVDQDQLEGSGTDRQQSRLHYENSYASLVTESSVEDQCLFITEKSYKPMYNLHPFLILGNPGVLKSLREQGYETFPEIFDESYDEMTVVHKRFAKVMENIDSIIKMPVGELHQKFIGLKDKLIHNRERLLKVRFKERFIKVINEISEKKNDKSYL